MSELVPEEFSGTHSLTTHSATLPTTPQDGSRLDNVADKIDDLVDCVHQTPDDDGRTQQENIEPSAEFQSMTGAPGQQVADGPTGPQGPIGVLDPSSDKVPTGSTNPQGQQGTEGVAGPQDETGIACVQGAQGDAGPTCLQGEQGVLGQTSAQTPRGSIGPRSPEGPIGQSFDPDASGLTVDRAAFGASPQNNLFGNTEMGAIYWKLSNDPGEWSAEVMLEHDPSGVRCPHGETGTKGTTGPFSSQGTTC